MDAGHTRLQTGIQKTAGFMKQSFGVAMPLAAAGAAVAVVKFGVDAVRSFQESEQVMALTEAALKSTGGAAGVTAADVVNLAHTWQGLTGIQDEAIQSSANMLLTFRNVHNEVGRGNDIFTQAEVAILDMATAMNKGATPSADQLQAAAIRLGKALNDPIAGMTGLSKAGVQFSDAQKDTIAALVASGDLMGAQKVILGELSAQFGGAAKAAGDTFAGSLAKLGAAFDDFKERVGAIIVSVAEKLLPVLRLAIDNLGLILGVLAGFAAVKFLPPLLNSIGFGILNVGAAGATAGTGMIAFAGSLAAIAGPAAALGTAVFFATKGIAGLIENVTGLGDDVHTTAEFIGVLEEKLSSGAITADEARAAIEDYNTNVVGMGDFARIAAGDVAGLTGAVADVDPVLEETGGAISDFAGLTNDEFTEWRAKSVDSLNGVAGSLAELADDAHLTANEIIRAFRRQIDAMSDYQTNWEDLLARGLPDSLAMQLQEMGLEGAEIVATLAGANRQKFTEIVADWEEAQGISKETAGAISELGGSVEDLPKSARIRITAEV
ncbi:MAG: hypothetical protein ACT4PO_05860, partial [Actinomycetota bacterium]